MSEMITARSQPLQDFCAGVLGKLGLSADDAAITAEVLVAANLRGVDTHGVIRMSNYSERIKGGWVNPRAKLSPLRETATTALVDAENGLGQVMAYRAMEMAIAKARGRGISYVAVRNSNHFGTCANFSMMAVPHDMIGIVVTNAGPCIAPTGGAEILLGNNPWSVAVPAGERLPVVLDMANSVVARGKIRAAAKQGQSIPADWALNVAGEPTTDPKEAMKGLLLPIGGYKGYGITLMVDILAGVLGNSGYGPRVRGTDFPDGVANVGHAFMALDISAFDEVDEFKKRMDQYIDEIKAVKKAKGVESIYLPGELEFMREKERRQKGIPIPNQVAEELRGLSSEFGIPLEL